MLRVYNSALEEKREKMKLNNLINQYSNLLVYCEKDDYLKIKIVPEGAMLLSPKGLIEIEGKIIQRNFERKKTIEIGGPNLIEGLSSIK